jgi:hypothetical protein
MYFESKWWFNDDNYYDILGWRYGVIPTWERSWSWYVNKDFGYVLDEVESIKVRFFIVFHLELKKKRTNYQLVLKSSPW